MKAYGGVRVQLHTFLISTNYIEVTGQLHEPAALPRRKAPGADWVERWSGFRVGMEVSNLRKISLPPLVIEPQSSVVRSTNSIDECVMIRNSWTKPWKFIFSLNSLHFSRHFYIFRSILYISPRTSTFFAQLFTFLHALLHFSLNYLHFSMHFYIFPSIVYISPCTSSFI
jgi:hypothetical protein